MGVGNDWDLVMVVVFFKENRLDRDNNDGDAIEGSGFIVWNGVG